MLRQYRAGRPTPDEHPLVAGAASVELPLPAGVPLAGYGGMARRLAVPDLLGRHPHAFWLKPSTGVRDPIRARALVVEGQSKRLLWVAADLIAVDSALVADVVARAAAEGFTYSAVIVSASHTHSGPGAFIDSSLFAFLATDRLDGAVRRGVLDGIVAAVRSAEGARSRARAGAAVGTATGLTRSRLDLPLDPRIALLKFVTLSGAPIALVWNYAIHGTVLGPGNLRLSSDVMGVASALLERRFGVPALFVNGAVGDVSPGGHGDAAAAAIGARLAEAVGSVWDRAEPREGAGLSMARGRVELSAPFASIRNCIGDWVPAFLTVPLDWALPRSAEIVAVGLGDAAWVTAPGELETRLGQAVSRAGRGRFGVTFVAGLSNGYLGYLLTRAAYRHTGYIGCASLYGEEAGERVARVAADLLERLDGGTATRQPPGAAPAPISSGQRCCGESRPW